MDTAQILKIQKELAQRTLEYPAQRHKRLYRLVRDAGWLRSGLNAVFTNRGSHTPGLDGVTKQHVDGRQKGRERLVQELGKELLSGEYRPQPVKRVYIPKANGKLRPLGIATLRDRVVQATLKMVLEPIYLMYFCTNLMTGMYALTAYVQSGHTWLLHPYNIGAEKRLAAH